MYVLTISKILLTDVLYKHSDEKSSDTSFIKDR